ncbi:MAG: 2-hydroxyacyl-CoA dehydratase [Clostridia bacterium]|nr:2-hydroxyacyl-CoA dehydratase [Clostridia bacterium]
MEIGCAACGACGLESCSGCEEDKTIGTKQEIPTPDNRVVFTKEMKKTHTLLVPTMLPMHFNLFIEVFRKNGYKMELLENEGRRAVDCGVKYVHNDACYPSICVIGQFIDALQSGKYDTDHVALIYMQTGGGCRASNYVSLMRKALERAGFAHVPIVTINIAGLEKHPGFKVTVPMYRDLLNCCLYADLMMLLRNQCRVREVKKGQTDALCDHWVKKLSKEIWDGRMRYSRVKENMRKMAADFALIDRVPEQPVRVGIVGEIYVKYSPLGNNYLEEFLYREGAEAVVPGLLDFMYYCVHNNRLDYELYGMRSDSRLIWNIVCRYFEGKKDDFNAIVAERPEFYGFSSYAHLLDLARRHHCVGMGMKMGEGWLLTSEMLELCEMGVTSIVCCQPFGCLPNHIVGKGMMRPIKACYPDANIVAIDFDPGASRINQENRLKLMMSNARK